MNADIKFKLITPCILGGADQRKAEMRIPSIRGQLRWWSRALGYGNLPEVFGGTDNDAKASTLIIRDLTEDIGYAEKNGEQLSGNRFDYFLWPMRSTRQDPTAGSRGILLKNQEVHIRISEKKVKTDVTLPDQVLKAFLLLGALGTRSRRCYGSIYPTEVTIDGEQWSIPTTIDDLKNELEGILDSDAECYIRTITDKPCRDYKYAIRKCADFLKTYRCGSKRSGTPSQWGENDHDARFRNVDELYRPALGLPLTQRYSDHVTLNTSVDGFERLASPVHFKVIELSDGFWPIEIVFPSHSEVVGKNAKLSGHGIGKHITIANDLLVEMMFPESEDWDEGFELGDFRE